MDALSTAMEKLSVWKRGRRPALGTCGQCGRPSQPGDTFCPACGTHASSTGSAARTHRSSERLPRASVAQGRYRLLRPLGEGGRKQVFLAQDTRLDREVALALLKNDAADGLVRERVLREARVMARLGDHPGIVQIFDIGEDRGTWYIVTEFMPGGTLADRLATAPDHRLPVDQALLLAADICAALAHVHSHGVIHRDLKPENLWLAQNGRVRLGDFGLARLPEQARLTGTDLVAGTLAYLPPEQARGEEPDVRGDLYALGVVLYEMLSGHLPFVAVDLLGVASHGVARNAAAPSRMNPAVPETLDRLVLSLLAADPAQRPPNAAAVQAVLQAADAPAAIDLSSPGDGHLFIGREDELQALAAAMDNVRAGHGRSLVVAAEPGMGKTRLVLEFRRRAASSGALVVIGRCHEGDGAPVYWPWVQVLRVCAQACDDNVLLQHLGPGASDIVQVLPELCERLPQVVAAAADGDPEQRRFRLFDAFAGFLRRVAGERPLVVVVDDLHWADKPSMLLLQFLVRELAEARVLLLSTTRVGEVGPRHPLHAVLLALKRLPQHRSLTVGGLKADEVHRLLEAMAGGHLPTAFAHGLAQVTEGNPFFVTESFRHLVEQGLLVREGERWVPRAEGLHVRLPDSVREVLGRRLDRLSDTCLIALRIASVLGREFDAAQLDRIADLKPGRLASALAEAVEAKVLQALPAARRYSFAHALMREALYEQIRERDRAALHCRAGEIIEQQLKDERSPTGAAIADRDARLPELAHHYFRGMSADTVDRAVAYCLRAGEWSIRNLAYEEATRQFERALRALDRQGADRAPERARLLLRLADSLRRSAETQRAEECYIAAATLAEREGEVVTLAQAALGLGSVNFGASWWAGLDMDRRLVDWLKRARAAVGEQHADLRAALAARLTLELYWSAGWEYGGHLADEAVRYAQGLDGSVAAAVAAAAQCYGRTGPDHAQGYAERVARCIALAQASGDRGLVLHAQVLQFFDLTTCPDRDTLDSYIEGYCRQAEDLREVQHRWFSEVLRATQALMDARVAQAEAIATGARELAGRAEDRNGVMIWGAQIGVIRFFQARTAELEAGFRGFAARYPSIPSWRAAVVLIVADNGRDDEARREFDEWSGRDFTDMRRDALWFNGAVMFAFAAFACGHQRAALRLYELLAPYEDRYAMVPPALGSRGPVAFALAALALLLQRREQAGQHLERALAVCERMRDRPYALYTQTLSAVLLALGTDPAGIRAGAELLAGTRRECRERGISSLCERPWFRRRVRELGRDPATRQRLDFWLLGETGDQPRRHAGTADHRVVGLLPRWIARQWQRIQSALRHAAQRLLGRWVHHDSDVILERRFGGARTQAILFGLMAMSYQRSAGFGFSGDIRYELTYPETGREAALWTLSVTARGAQARRGDGARPAVSVRMSVATLMRITVGQLNPVAAMVEGLTEVEGDLSVASRLVEMFGGFAPEGPAPAEVRRSARVDLRGMHELLSDLDIEPALPSGAPQTVVERIARVPAARGTDLDLIAGEDGTVTILFSDVEGFTQMTERLGDSAALRVMQRHNRIVRRELHRHDGREVELQGDGFVLVFASASQAQRCAIAIQQQLREHNATYPQDALRVRMGLHSGEAIQDAHKFFGRSVIIAARIAAQASGEEVLVSDAVRERAGDVEFSYGPQRRLSLKGLAGEHAAHALLWQ